MSKIATEYIVGKLYWLETISSITLVECSALTFGLIVFNYYSILFNDWRGFRYTFNDIKYHVDVTLYEVEYD